MPVTRRTALTILGGIAIGYGTIGASGAFDRVELHRDVDVTVGGDMNGYLLLEPHPDRDFSSGYGPIVDYDDGLLYVDFTSADINDEGETIFEDMIRATNQGSQIVELTADPYSADGNLISSVELYREGGLPGELGKLASGDDVDIHIKFDTFGQDDADQFDHIRFVAE